ATFRLRSRGHDRREIESIPTRRSSDLIARELGFQFRCFDEISKEEKHLKNQYRLRYSAEYDKIETEIRELEAEIGNLEREIESRSFEIKNNISQRIEDLESEIYELENIRFSLSSLF